MATENYRLPSSVLNVLSTVLQFIFTRITLPLEPETLNVRVRL